MTWEGVVKGRGYEIEGLKVIKEVCGGLRGRVRARMLAGLRIKGS